MGEQVDDPRKLDERVGTTVLLVDDHPIVRQCVAHLLEGEQERWLSVTEQAGDGVEALELVEDQGPPHAVLMDVDMPRMNGIEATREIRRRWPQVVVIGLSMHGDASTRDAMRGAGAVDVFTKSGSAHGLIDALRRLTARQR